MIESNEKEVNYRDILNKMNANINTILYIEGEKKEAFKMLNESKRIKQINDKELNNTKIAIALLKSKYNQLKEETRERLQEEISKTVNKFFNNSYNLELVPGVTRGKSTVDLVELDSKGNSVGSLQVMLSGAEQQMAGFSTQKITLANLGGKFMILDEAFSSFGMKEITQMADILRSIDDVQIILIEHKNLGDLKVPTYRVERVAFGTSKTTKIVDTKNLDMIDWEKSFSSDEERIKYYTYED